MWKQVFGGMLVGALVCGGMTDTYGRKPVCGPHPAMMAGVAWCTAQVEHDDLCGCCGVCCGGVR